MEKDYGIVLVVQNKVQNICIKVSHIQFSDLTNLNFLHFKIANIECHYQYNVELDNCTFTENNINSLIKIAEYNATQGFVHLTVANSHFTSNKLFRHGYLVDIQVKATISVSFKSSIFCYNYDLKLIRFTEEKDSSSNSKFLPSHLGTIYIKNTTFLSNRVYQHIINASQAAIILDGPVLFLKNYGRGLFTLDYKISFLQMHGQIIPHGNDLIEALYDTGSCTYDGFYIRIKENSDILITNNRI